MDGTFLNMGLPLKRLRGLDMLVFMIVVVVIKDCVFWQNEVQGVLRVSEIFHTTESKRMSSCCANGQEP